MSVGTLPAPLPDAPRRLLFTVEEYYRMAEVGIIKADARVELIGGVIVTMSPVNERHISVLQRIQKELTRGIPDSRGLVFIQTSLWLSSTDDPVPDAYIAKPSKDEYAGGRPTSKDILLVIEVSDTTLRTDRDIKGPLYARSGIPEYWIFDVKNEVVEVRSAPAKGVYTRVKKVTKPAGLTPSKVRSFSLDLRKIFK